MRVSGSMPKFGALKDKKNRPRTIPLGDVVMAALVEHVRTFGLGPEELLFTNDSNEPIRRTTFADIWARAVEAAGHPGRGGVPSTSALTTPGLLIHEGCSIVGVQKMLGHAKPGDDADI